MKTIYLAGGCFWGVEKYLGMINGVVATEVGYANSDIENPTYEDLCNARSLASEVVKVTYDSTVTLDKILNIFLKVIDPTSINKQGNDRGAQYRTGIYYIEDDQKEIALKFIKEIQLQYEKPIAIEVLKIENYTKAEDYHQDYLNKNKDGYCHINFANFSEDDFK